MREVVIDVETTGLDPGEGHRVIEIGCVELINVMPTGRTYQTYLNPERAVSSEARAVHGLTSRFLADKPLFSDIVFDFLSFIGSAPLVAHNAMFDLAFINSELSRAGIIPIPKRRMVDTLALARKLRPGAPASLDALCRAFKIDLAGREYHGALLDARLLAEVYLNLRGSKQPDLGLVVTDVPKWKQRLKREYREPRPHRPTLEELARHLAFLNREIPNAVWLKGRKGN